MRHSRTKIFIDGDVLVHSHFSGIGHYTAELLRAVDRLLYKEQYSDISVEIGVPVKSKHKMAAYNFENLAIKGMPVSHRISNGLKKRSRLPPIDLFFGKRVYIFPNYSSWPTFRSPNISIIYDLSFVHHAEFVEPQNQAFLVSEVQKSINRADGIITISTNSKQEIADYYKYPANKITICYPAVDMHKFYRRSAHEIEYIKAKYGIFGEYILYVGNIEPRKNLVTLLKAYQLLPKNIQSKYALLLIGAKGWLDDEIRDTIISMRIKGLRILQPTDYVIDEDLPALFSGAKAFTYVSRYEGFGIPPVEAMACGTPVISSNNSSLPEAVGSAALMIDALDEAALAKSIEKIVTDQNLTEKLTGLGYEQITKFDWQASAENLLNLAREANR